MEFEWGNLIFACISCNRTKGKVDNIINPIFVDPENCISLSISADEDIKDKVIITILDSNYELNGTVALLEKIYNAKDGSDQRKQGSSKLRNNIAIDVRRFEGYIKLYLEEPDLGYDKKIRNALSISSEFVSFKRQIIRDDPKLYEIFKDDF